MLQVLSGNSLILKSLVILANHRTETVAISHNGPSDPNHFRLAGDWRATL